MRIGMVLETAFPPDIRVEKEIRALRAGGHEVVMLCGHKDGQPSVEQTEHGRVVRYHEVAESKASKVASLLHYWATARKRGWERAIEDFVEANGIEALHIHDLPLVPTGLAVARRRSIPLIFDMHEVYPVMIRGKFPTQADFRHRFNSGVHSTLFSPGWWDRVEKRAVEQADRVVVVIDESKDRLVRMGISEDKIAVVLNAEDIDGFLALPPQQDIAARYADDFLVGYVGGVDNPNRGLDNLVRAWPLLLESIPNARLIIVGDGPLRSSVEETARELNLSERLVFAGWVPFDQVPDYVRALQVAVIPHIVNEHTNNTIPHKLFQYIALGKIVVASDITPIRRILEDTGAGVIVREWSPQGFADAILRAHTQLRSGDHNPEHQEAVLRARYGFNAVSEPLLKLYDGLKST
jgi:glycosyltransferase involved in cell wall biosynthesis